jgi:predicted outer membrane repeat protein
MLSRKAFVIAIVLVWLLLPAPVSVHAQDVQQHEILLTALCSPEPQIQRVWRVTNFTPNDTAFTWNLVGTGQSGGGIVPANGEIIFTTQTVDDPNVVALFIDDRQVDIRDSVIDACNPNPTPTFTPTLVPPTATSTAVPCDVRNLRADLIGTLHDGGAVGVITNIGSLTCSYKVGIASYYKFDEDIDKQVIYAYDNPTVTLASGQSVELRAPVPSCAYQADLFYGDVIIPMFYGQRYSPRLLAYFHGGGDYCMPATETPLPTETYTAVPPSVTPTPTETPDATVSATPTATYTAAPEPLTFTPSVTETPTNMPEPSAPTFTPSPTNTLTQTTDTPTATLTPSSTSTDTPVPPTATFTPSSTPTNTPVPPTATFTPSSTPTNTPVGPTPTYTPSPIAPDCTFSVPSGDVYGTSGLIAAINAANAGPDADLICLTPGSTYVLDRLYAGLAGLPAVVSPISIRGSGARLERSDTASEFRLFTVETSGSLTLQTVTLSGGRTLNGGAVFSSGALTVTGSTLTSNTATGGGGAIYLDRGTATINAVIFTSNVAGSGGAIYASGAILNLTSSVLEGNRAGNFGGALLNFAGEMTITGVVLRDNAALRGGGLYVSAAGTLTGSQNSISYNVANASGGGIETDSANATLTGGCFVGNEAPTGSAGVNNQASVINVESNFWGRATGPNAGELAGNFDFEPFLTDAPADCVVTAPLRGVGLSAGAR